MPMRRTAAMVAVTAAALLAVGAPPERVGTRRSAGAVSVFSGSGQGLRTPGTTFVQGGGGLGGTAEAFDAFGAALA